MTASISPEVIWHDLECGAYAEDQHLWRSLADELGDPVLEIGAGTGRITLDLARRGHHVIALDRDPSLIDALNARAAAEGLSVEAEVADARKFELERTFRLCLVPMQTIQLFGGPQSRASFLRCVRRHIEPRGLLAIALASELETYDIARGSRTPVPDLRELDGVVYASVPVAVREEESGFVLERRREVVQPSGEHSAHHVETRLDRLSAAMLEREAERYGFTRQPRQQVAASHEYAGSVVVMLRA